MTSSDWLRVFITLFYWASTVKLNQILLVRKTSPQTGHMLMFLPGRKAPKKKKKGLVLNAALHSGNYYALLYTLQSLYTLKPTALVDKWMQTLFRDDLKRTFDVSPPCYLLASKYVRTTPGFWFTCSTCKYLSCLYLCLSSGAFLCHSFVELIPK